MDRGEVWGPRGRRKLSSEGRVCTLHTRALQEHSLAWTWEEPMRRSHSHWDQGQRTHPSPSPARPRHVSVPPSMGPTPLGPSCGAPGPSRGVLGATSFLPGLSSDEPPHFPARTQRPAATYSMWTPGASPRSAAPLQPGDSRATLCLHPLPPQLRDFLEGGAIVPLPPSSGCDSGSRSGPRPLTLHEPQAPPLPCARLTCHCSTGSSFPTVPTLPLAQAAPSARDAAPPPH